MIRAKADRSYDPLLLYIILDESIVKDIIPFHLVVGNFPFLNHIMTSNVAVPTFITSVCLANIWEFHVHILDQVFSLHLLGGKVELHSLEDGALFSR